MQLVVQVRIHTDTGDDGVGELIEIATIHRDGPLTSSTVGMSIEEAKQILAGIDDVVVTSQTSRAVAAANDCADCGRGFASKDTRQIVMRSLYGTHHVESPRWWTCPCAGDRSTFSPLSKMLVGRSTPELALVEAKLAAHISYPAAAGLLEELFPTGRRIHRNEIRRTVTHLAERLDGELDDDEFNYMNPRAIDRSTVPDMPMTATLDGGYVHSSDQRSRRDGWFQAVCGTVTTHDGTTRRFGFVPGADETPRSRIRAVLDAQGLRQDQLVTFLTDGADDLAGFCEYMNYTADYVLDWFHIAMRFTVLTNTTTTIAWTVHDEDDLGVDQAWCDSTVGDMREQIGRAKWLLWHGNHRRALQVLDDATETMHCCDDNTARTKSLRMVGELVVYLERNQHRLPSYAERNLAGEPISSAPAESAVNQVIAKRMVKKQQMRWTPAGAHRLLQIRTRVLDHQLDNDINRWHPTQQPIAA
jgi:hypothetical protein